MSMEDILDYKGGGLVIQRHNKVRDTLGDSATMAYRGVLRELIVKEAGLDGNVLMLIADLGVCGLWQPWTEASFDVCIIDTDAKSYCH